MPFLLWTVKHISLNPDLKMIRTLNIILINTKGVGFWPTLFVFNPPAINFMLVLTATDLKLQLGILYLLFLLWFKFFS